MSEIPIVNASESAGYAVYPKTRHVVDMHDGMIRVTIYDDQDAILVQVTWHKSMAYRIAQDILHEL